MMSQTYHETIFKSLQELKSLRPVIALFTLPHRIPEIQNIVKALGLSVIFPCLETDNLKNYKKVCRAVVIDSVVCKNDFDTNLKEVFPKNLLNNHSFINICDEAVAMGKVESNVFKNITRYNPKLFTFSHDTQKDNLLEIIKKSMKPVLSFRSMPIPAILHPQPFHDIFYNQAEDSVKVVGVENINHIINCSSLSYAVLAAGLSCVTENIPIAAISASVLLRAASRRALSVTNGPGSFVPVFLDTLFHLKRDYIYQVQVQDKFLEKELQPA